MVIVDKVQETPTVLEMKKDCYTNRETERPTDRQADRQTGGQTDGCNTHHLKVTISDVAEGSADVTASEPPIGSLLSVLPGSQTAQGL